MSYNLANETETDEIEFTAAYGTAVVMIGTRQRDFRSHQQDALDEPGGNFASHVIVATSTDQH